MWLFTPLCWLMFALRVCWLAWALACFSGVSARCWFHVPGADISPCVCYRFAPLCAMGILSQFALGVLHVSIRVLAD